MRCKSTPCKARTRSYKVDFRYENLFKYFFPINFTGRQNLCQRDWGIAILKVFPTFGSLIQNPTIIFWSMRRFLQCCQFGGVWVENYIFEGFLSFPFLIWKGNISLKSDKWLWRYNASKLKNQQNLANLIFFNFMEKLKLGLKNPKTIFKRSHRFFLLPLVYARFSIS